MLGQSIMNQEHRKDQIRSGLYLGGYYAAVAVAETQDITHILTVTSLAPCELQKIPEVTSTKVVPLLDVNHENLLDSLEECLEFIDEGRRHQGGAVLVHCTQGVSRSVSVVIAYLMRKELLSLEDALKEVTRLRPQARPNPGFLEQLEMFDRMGCKVDKKTRVYAEFRRFYAKQLRHAYINAEKFSASQFAALEDGHDHDDDLIVRCRKCSVVVARRLNLMHDIGNECCGSVFLEPMQWMAPQIIHDDEGELNCAGCGAMLGQFNWDELQCKCKTFEMPAFQLDASDIIVTSLQTTC